MPSDLPGKRVQDILEAIAKITAYVDDIGGIEALLKDDFVHRDAVERQLLTLSEAAVKLRGQVEKLEPGIEWHAIRGMGNIIRHGYDEIEDAVIERVLAHELAPLKHACKRLQAHFGS